MILLEARMGEDLGDTRGAVTAWWGGTMSGRCLRHRLGLDCQRQPKRLIALMRGGAGAAASTVAIARLAHQCSPLPGHGNNGGPWRRSARSGRLALQKRRHSALAVDGV